MIEVLQCALFMLVALANIVYFGAIIARAGRKIMMKRKEDENND